MDPFYPQIIRRSNSALIPQLNLNHGLSKIYATHSTTSLRHQQSAIGTAVPPAHGGAPGPWSTGLCDCCSNVPNCCITFWCPCITFGQIAEIVDRGSTSCGVSGALYTLLQTLTGCGCIYSCFYRKKMRKQYMLEDSPCGDCLVHCCCECCALCQEYRELQYRGFDLDLGWQGNADRHNQGVTMAPVAQGGMYR